MRYRLWLICAFVFCLPMGVVQGQRIDPKRQYPRFQIGPTGVYATIEPGLVMTVESTEADSLADGKLLQGDVILAAGGRSLEVADPRVPLGEALGQAEATDGRLVLRIERNGQPQDVTVAVAALGPYAKAWPADCAKSRQIVEQTARFVAAAQQSDGSYRFDEQSERDGLTGCLAGLFLLSTGEPKYLANVRLHARNLADAARQHPSTSTWHLGYQGILVAEYYLTTGDRDVLPGLTSICRQAARAQQAGAWGHGLDVNPGYTQSGLMNSAGVSLFTALALARECGVTESEEAFLKSLKFFYRMAGHGAICYGDHRSELFPNTNGRSATMACAFSLLDGECYQMAARHLARIVSDSYYAPEFGHTGGGFNVIWRGLGTMHVPADAPRSYRRQMDRLAWYYDLARMPGGGFSMLPSPPNTTRYCGRMWGTGAIGLTYTAPRRTLRITGKARTPYSVDAPPLSELPWGTKADLAFLRSDFCEGYGADDVDPHVAYAELFPPKTTPDVAFCAKMMRHYSPMIRTWAARKLADKADEPSIDAIVTALHHQDPRVRRAAMDGISGYDNWGRGRFRGNIPPEVVSSRCLGVIERALNDPQTAWWEIDGALWALGRATPEGIRKNMPLIRKFAVHEEWYLREAAFWAVVGLRKEITGEEFEFLADVYRRSRHVFPRGSYDMAFNYLLHSQKVELDQASADRIVRKLGFTAHSALIADRYGRAGKHEATHRTMMVFARFDDPTIYRLVLDDLVRYLDDWTPDYQHSAWLVTGNSWQPGLVKVAENLGADAEPLIVAFEKCLARVEWDESKRDHKTCRELLRKAVDDYRQKFGR